MAGPFAEAPFSPFVVSPLNTVPKKDTDDRRVITDLSWPFGSSVNDGISSESYLGEEVTLKYASIESVCALVLEVGEGAHIYKRDLKQAYRQIPVDPGDYCLLGYYWNDNLYFDVVLAMGQRNAAMACTRTTSAVMFIHRCRGCRGANYLDDLIGVAPPLHLPHRVCGFVITPTRAWYPGKIQQSMSPVDATNRFRGAD